MKGEIINIKEIAKETYETTLLLDSEINFKAGQYIFLSKIIQNKKYKMAFSIASSPKEQTKIKIVFRIQDNSSPIKKELVKLKTSFDIEPPLGKFIIPKNNNKDIFMIAGGIGIAPYISILEDLDNDKKVTLIYTSKDPEKIAYKKFLENLENENANFKLILRLQRADKEFLKKEIENKKANLFMICGSPEMIKEISDFLLKEGIKKENILVERF